MYGIPLDRTSKDTHRLNEYGRRLLGFCKDNDIYICNGRVGVDRYHGDLTCKDSSVIDYMITSPQLLCTVHKFEVEPFDALFSDRHCLINIFMKCKANVQDVNIVVNKPKAIETPIWNNFKCENFINEIMSDNVQEVVRNLVEDDSCDVKYSY